MGNHRPANLGGGAIMKDEGWTLSDLDGELRARGCTLDDITSLEPILECPHASAAADTMVKMTEGER